MSNRIIQSKNAPAAIGPYSQAIMAGDLLYTSGQLGLDPDTGDLAAGIEAQTKQSLKNVQAILEEAGLQKTDVIKTVVFLKNMSDFAVVNGISLPPSMEISIGTLPGKRVPPWPPQVSPHTIVKRCQPSVTEVVNERSF